MLNILYTIILDRLRNLLGVEEEDFLWYTLGKREKLLDNSRFDVFLESV